MAIALHVVPVTACEVGHLDGQVAVVHGDRAEFSQRAPFRHVIDVHVEWQSILQAVHQAGIHDEIHSAVSAHFLSHFPVSGDERMLVFLFERLLVFSREVAVSGEIVGRRAHTGVFHRLRGDGIALRRVFVGEAAGARQLIHAVVGLRRHHVVVNLNHLPLFGADERCRMVAVAEVPAWLSRALFHQLLSVE